MPSLSARSARHRPPDPAPLAPPLKWAGGKRWQLPVLRPLWRPHAARRLVEPFCGGLAVTLGLAPGRALLNDINPHLINFYQWLKRGLTIDVRLANSRTVFYANRARFNTLLRGSDDTGREAAGLFYYLNRTAYNGLCRFNSRGDFNVPFGQYNRIGYERNFDAYRETFASWEFLAGDFASIPLDAEDFIYADPPYDVEFTKYAKEGFDWDDQVRAARWCARHAVPVILVNQATDRICRLYADLGFTLEFLNAPRRISCTGDRTPAREVLAVRNL
jgi:DNA adenine methylase